MTHHTPLGIDPNSYANYHEVIVTDIRPNLTIDFARKRLHGYTDLVTRVLHNYVRYLDLDIRGLAIESVRNLDEPVRALSYLCFTIPKNHPIGANLRIPIPENKQEKDNVFNVRIYYSTTEHSGGIQWFEPHQTEGKKHPFMYTQFQAILARSMVPCQDTPAVKSPYTIKITVEAPLVAACSGALTNTTRNEKDGTITYEFHQKIPIPSYLIALGCGALEREQIGPRSFVWCERELLEPSKNEFAETEDYIQAAEKICGLPYLWGTYDLLILPAAFPYGGMENPNLTFVNKCLITGNRELTDVIAHEITHSWSGNLVTNSSWPDFWLNEGFTMYIERLILREVAEKKHKGTGNQVRDFAACLGYGELISTVNSLKDDPGLTRLVPDMVGIDPDDAFSRIPYEKGCLLLIYLESLVGGIDAMIGWLHSYFSTFARQSIDHKQMIQHFETHFGDKIKNKVDWHTWLFGEGLGPWDPSNYLDQSLNNRTKDLSSKWLDQKGEGTCANDITTSWDAEMTMVFLDHLINSGRKLDKDVLQKLDATYKLSKTRNVEVLVRYLRLCLNSDYVGVMPDVEHFLATQGRGVYLKPLYSQLINLSDRGILNKEYVKSIYQKNRSFYHSVIRNTFDSQLE